MDETNREDPIEQGAYEPPAASLEPSESVNGDDLEGLGKKGTVLRGFLLGLAILAALELAAFTLAQLLTGPNSETALFAFFLPGAVEWVVVIPLAIYLGRKGSAQTVRGLLVTAGVIALLNATCCGLIMVSL